MSVVLTGVIVSVLYAAAVVGIHRWNVSRLRRRGNFAALLRVDWDALLSTFPLPSGDGEGEGAIPAVLPTGEPTPETLKKPVAAEHRPRRDLLIAIVAGTPPADLIDRAKAAGFSGGETHWLQTLALFRTNPDAALERLESIQPSSAQEVYLREYLRLTRRTTPLNLEVQAFATKRRVAAALSRFEDAPCLYFVRALASSMIGLNRQAIDDIARAVYFSHQHPFYVRVVLDTEFIADARPALVYQCRQAAQPKPQTEHARA